MSSLTLWREIRAIRARGSAAGREPRDGVAHAPARLVPWGSRPASRVPWATTSLRRAVGLAQQRSWSWPRSSRSSRRPASAAQGDCTLTVSGPFFYAGLVSPNVDVACGSVKKTIKVDATLSQDGCRSLPSRGPATTPAGASSARRATASSSSTSTVTSGGAGRGPARSRAEARSSRCDRASRTRSDPRIGVTLSRRPDRSRGYNSVTDGASDSAIARMVPRGPPRTSRTERTGGPQEGPGPTEDHALWSISVR